MDLHMMGRLMDDPDLHIRVRAACALHDVGMTDTVLSKVAQAATGSGGEITDQAIMDAVATFVPPTPAEADDQEQAGGPDA